MMLVVLYVSVYRALLVPSSESWYAGRRNFLFK
jgi:hypothetical protein